METHSTILPFLVEWAPEKTPQLEPDVGMP